MKVTFIRAGSSFVLIVATVMVSLSVIINIHGGSLLTAFPANPIKYG